MENNRKMGLFLQNARLLSDTLGIVPLLYGSLGLEYLSGDDLAADDIDILIPKTFITDRWSEFKGILESYGYILTDAHEHTFVREGVSYSYADVEDLETFAGIRCEEILRREADSFAENCRNQLPNPFISDHLLGIELICCIYYIANSDDCNSPEGKLTDCLRIP